MILELTFILGLTTGIVAGLILFYFIFRDDFRAVEEFNKRQEDYKRRI